MPKKMVSPNTNIITPDLLLAAYSNGLFPMADNAKCEQIGWYCPEIRGQLSIPNMHIPRRLKKNIRQMKIGGKPYEIRINTDFKHVINACAKQTQSRPETWINKQIIETYCKLHEQGYAHSLECWQNNEMVGGLYGIAIGGAFFGESMFSTVHNSSKVSLVHLAARLGYAGFEILDTQFTNSHLEQFGVYEISHKDYMKRLEPALHKKCNFNIDNIEEFQLVKNYLDTSNIT